MPPRIHSQPLAGCLEISTLASRPQCSCAPRPWLAEPVSAAPKRASMQIRRQRQQQQQQQQTAAFSTTSARPVETKARQRFKAWLDKYGKEFKEHRGQEADGSSGGSERGGQRQQQQGGEGEGEGEGSGPNYLAQSWNTPFPLNPTFRSMPVLSEASRETIYASVHRDKMQLKVVSAKYGVDVRRVAAILRLKAVEKEMVEKGKPLALPYAKAVMGMLPQHHIARNSRPYEPINEIHVHSRTMQQLFVPASESRQFTRADAAAAFGDHILPADARVPLPELVRKQTALLAGQSEAQAQAQFEADVRDDEAALAERLRAREARKAAKTTTVSAGRFEFRVEDINVDHGGPKGRSRRGVGWRYGVPLYDRKKGEVKIPTKVE